MDSVVNKIRLELEDGTFEEDFLDCITYGVLIYLNETCIGDIVGSVGDDSIHIELIELDDEYRGKKYGKIALDEFKKIGKSLGIKTIDGECPNRLLRFYNEVGAKFECREAVDFDYILNKFYIDL